MTTASLPKPSPTPPGSRASAALPIQIQHVSKAFPAAKGPRLVLDNINLDIEAGQIIALVGASGCGKSTLLRQIAGLDAPTSGQILIGGTPVAGVDPRCSVGFQEPRLLPWRTIAANVALGVPRGTAKTEQKQRVHDLLSQVGLSQAAQLRPRQISGGMAQRASLARALARQPGVLLLDEPFGALDALTRLQMQQLLLDLHRRQPTTVVFVTHDVDEALGLADRIVLLGCPTPANPGAAATIRQIVTPPGPRPRDRSARAYVQLRAQLLAALGVDATSTTA